MLENCLSDFTYLKEILDNETDSRFFDREFSFFADRAVLFYLAGTGRIIYVSQSFTRRFGYTSDDLREADRSIADLFCHQHEYADFNLSAQHQQPLPEKGFCLLSANGEETACMLSDRWLYKDCHMLSVQSGDTAEPGKNEPAGKNKELDEFAYVASHDLQEPLRKITTFIQRLEQKLGSAADEDVHLYIKRINVSAANMRNLIDSLLAFSRVDRHNGPPEPVDLSGVLTGVIKDITGKPGAADASINMESLPVVEATSSQMQQLFHCLLDNAVKFHKEHIAPVINITSREITDAEKEKYRLARNKSYCMITVSDNGIGFDPLYAEKIFQLFQRLHGKHEYPGAGMGLGICKRIVENTGGYIYADGVPGEGSRFYIILPKYPVTDV
jgi:signal transduction histidine kinase